MMQVLGHYFMTTL